MPEGSRNGQKPTASVVIPAYNAERFIGDAIRTVLGQTFQDFELIIIDDGSCDRTVEIAKPFDDPRIRIHSQENGEESSARNAGWRRAKADLVAFLDQDDLWVPDRLAFLGCAIRFLANSPIRAVRKLRRRKRRLRRFADA